MGNFHTSKLKKAGKKSLNSLFRTLKRERNWKMVWEKLRSFVKNIYPWIEMIW